ncbi:MAG: class I tRNA ligase family protein, partial [Clostridia bacterium]|nr:class I tRNA ligase family protein [Clostridia bacterium]
WYNGGMEHTTLHLLYSRFWHLFLHDLGVVSAPEPYQKRTSHGMILGENGEKMSKSRGNVINPDDTVAEIGADAFRLYEMFMGAFDQAIPWQTDGARGCRRFLDRVWKLMERLNDDKGISKELAYDINTCIKKVSEDYEAMKFNTAIAAMMTLVNTMYQRPNISKDELSVLVQLLNPVAPHITEEMNEMMGFATELVRKPWPQVDEKALVKDEIEIAVQVNGKVRCRVMVPSDLTRETANDYVSALPEVAKLLEGKTAKKMVYVPGRLFNIVL